MHGLELEQRVHFVGHQKKPLAWIDMLDVFVLPSKFEGMPNVVLEAMALKKAVVATRIPGLDEVVVDGETGFLVEPKKPFEIAKVLLKLYEQPELRAKFGEAALSGWRNCSLCHGWCKVTPIFMRICCVQNVSGNLFADSTSHPAEPNHHANFGRRRCLYERSVDVRNCWLGLV